MDNNSNKLPLKRRLKDSFKRSNRIGNNNENLPLDSNETSLQDKCPRKQVQCKYCSKEIRNDILDIHYKECPDFEIHCIFRNCNSTFKRFNSNSHYEEHSPSPFVAELTNLILVNKELKEDNIAKQDEINRLKGEITRLYNNFSILNQQLIDQQTPYQETPDQQTPDQQTPDQQTLDQQTPDQQTQNQAISQENPSQQTPDSKTQLINNSSPKLKCNHRWVPESSKRIRLPNKFI